MSLTAVADHLLRWTAVAAVVVLLHAASVRLDAGDPAPPTASTSIATTHVCGDRPCPSLPEEGSTTDGH